jgi:uncharacterized repeat protein (TIGR02543 family)
VNGGASLGAGNMPADPARSNYTFGGWYTAQNGGGTQFTASTPVTGNTTVYAKWTAIHTVSFNADGGTPATQTKTVQSGASIGADNMPTTPTRGGHTFDGWYTGQNGGGTQFTASTPVTGNATVYAKWTATVTFDADGGTPATQTKPVQSGASIGADNMPAEPTRNNYSFGGWYTAQNGGGTEFTASTPVTGNTTVYAKWNSGVSVTLQPQPDPPLSNKTVFTDDETQFSAAGTGYSSWQWYWNGEPIGGETSATYTLGANAKPPGNYELSVVVTTAGGAKLSARCLVTVKEGGE